ncbi:hypothetical protein WJX81_004872 [Elliptochloris bilobata]|uniref:Kinesin motor domain-containing protein n=1 Tax=Elliptochloris bilobata TaxID=381761 RepID=A0AAW1R3B4_9CHLO
MVGYSVFGGEGGEPSETLYKTSVAPLVAGLFEGISATVFAYGQTGSGKSHTMGTSGATPWPHAAELARGLRGRATSATLLNASSSRSHAGVTLHVRQRRLTPGGAPGREVLEAKLHLVDLAGSERRDCSGAVGQRLAEATSINSGLFHLREVIVHLAARARHIPYRNHLLTEVLADSLGGAARCVMIACVSPADTQWPETRSTLEYASLARKMLFQML